MNLPNKLTMLRMALIPVFLVCMMVSFPYHYPLALLIFAGASFTDLLDGKIARARGLVTNFGKFMDPLADKLLVMSALCCFTQLGGFLQVPAVVIVVILAREFAVTALRTLAADAGVVIAADRWGKIKTVTQMVWICYVLLVQCFAGQLQDWVARTYEVRVLWPLMVVNYLGMAVVLVATVGSGINYLYKNRQLFLNSK